MKSKKLILTVAALLSVAFTSTLHAQASAFTYQGRVTDNGTNFTSAGQFKFALVTSTNANHTATATANTPSGGYITGYTVTDGGNGYVTAPAVTVFGGGGSGATAHANISGGVVTGLTVDNTGDGNYTSAPMVTIDPPPPAISYTTYWSNDGTSVNGSEPSAAVSVAVSNGLFTVVLGDASVPNMAAIEASLFNQPNLQLRIWFNDGVNGFAALDPAQNLTPTPFAVAANSASNLLGRLPAAQISGTIASVNVAGTYGNAVTFGNAGNSFSGSGAGLTGLNASHLTSGAVPAAALGNAWKTGGNAGTTAGTQFIGTTDNQPLELRVNGQRALRLEPNTSGAPNVIGGSSANFVAPRVTGATIAGGGTTNYLGTGLTSYSNSVSGDFGTIGGGLLNTIQTNADYSTIGGGDGNTIQTNAGYSTIGGGFFNTASGVEATVPGGAVNTAAGDHSFAAGYGAEALNTGSFVWADAQGTYFSSTANNQFSVRAAGGVRLAGGVQIIGDVQIGTNNLDYHHLQLGGGNSYGYLYGSFPAYADGIHLSYNYYADANGTGHISNTGGATSRLTVGYGFVGIYVGGVNAAPMTQRLLANSTGVEVDGTFNNNSDRNAKQDFAPVSSAQILDEVLRLPLSEWSYKTDPKTRHVGPMAQDFYAAFDIGTDDKHIAPIDEGGVAFAAIQGLDQKVNSENATLRAENAELKEQLRQLRQLVNRLDQKLSSNVK